MTENVAPRPRNPPSEAWLAIKPIFLDLYLRQDKTLDEVRHYLETRHSFTASTKAFKLRVKQWSALKYRKRQKPRIGTSAATYGAIASTRPHRNGSANWGGQILSFADTTPARGFEAKDFTDSMTRMDQHIHDRSPYLVSATQNLWQWTMRSTLSPKMDHVWSSHLAPGWAMIDVVTLLSMPALHQQGQAKLLQVQESITSYISDAPAATFLAVLSLFTFEKWRPYPGVRTVLFNFIRGYAVKNLPAHHPLKRFLENATCEDVQLAAGQLIIAQVDTLLQLKQEGHDIPYWYFHGPTWGLLQAGLISDAHRLTIKLLHQTRSKLKRCRLLGMIIRGQFYGQDYDGTIKNSLALLPVIDELLAEGEFVWGDQINTYDLLSKAHAGKYQWDENIRYARLAFENSYKQFGRYSTNVKYYCHEWEDSVIKHGTPEELESLRSKYSFLFEEEPEPGPVTPSDRDSLGSSRAHLLAGSFNIEQGLEALIDL